MLQHSRRLTAGLVGLAALARVSAMRLDQAQPPVPSFRAGVQLVLVDVVVRDKKTGHLVTDLAKSDFEIKDEGKPQTIESFASIGMLDPHNAIPDTGTASLSTTDRVVSNRQSRLIAFFISDPWIPFNDTGYLRELLHRFVERHMDDNDEVAIWPVTNQTPQQDFTADRARLDAVIDRTQGTYAGIPAPPDQLLAHLDTALDRMAAIVSRRKVLILLGGEVLPPSLIGTSLYQDVLRRAAAANVGIYPVGVSGVVGMGEIIGPTGPGRALPSLLALSILAQETGGVVANRNNVDRSLERVEEDAGSYYLIGFSPAPVGVTPGHLRRLTVKVGRNGTIVQARRGYMPLPASGPL